MSEQKYSYHQLFEFTKEILQKIGCSEEHACTSAKVLLSADLRGIDSHGVARLSGYVRLWEVKRINTDPVLKIIHETPSTAVVDGDSGLGLVVAPFSMQVAIDKAK
ncbi:MAG TPA: Ldh family oxidoreductase, partial [Chitinophagaceae bacterium]